MFSKACEYGLKAMIFLAAEHNREELVNLGEIAAAIDSPAAFTSKVLQQLSRAGLVHSVRGPGGGFCITAEKLRHIRLSEIVLAIDGEQLFNGCGLGLKMCSDKRPCPIHHQYAGIRSKIRMMLEQTRLEEFTRSQQGKPLVLKI